MNNSSRAMPEGELEGYIADRRPSADASGAPDAAIFRDSAP
jgi:hypothetical protein